MKARNRFLKSVISTAKSEATQMPWSRGVVREAHLAQRRAPQSTQPASGHLTVRLKRA
ncbi:MULTISPECIES: hypothetical protein [unclassified Pseudophaeobacter]|uniref:hypothetical protein n=1 Tax=unclassified Pseudophaeobacter TaxID=2637024 RepID=UPI0013C52307|nr:hypothetical protein [Pseudophaeobacter sp. EL27]